MKILIEIVILVLFEIKILILQVIDTVLAGVNVIVKITTMNNYRDKSSDD